MPFTIKGPDKAALIARETQSLTSRLRRRFSKQAPQLSAICCALFLSCSPVTAWADLQTTLSVGAILFDRLRLSDVQVAMETDGDKLGGLIQIGRIQAADGSGTVSQMSLKCATLKLHFTRMQCRRGSLHLGDKAIALIDKLDVGKQIAGVRVQARMSRVQLAALGEILPILEPSLKGSSLTGLANVRLDLSSERNDIISGRLQLETQAMAVSNAQSTLATEDLLAALDLRFSKRKQNLDLKLVADLRAGYGYLQPVLQNYSEYPARLEISAAWNLARSHITLRSLQWDQTGAAKLQAHGSINSKAPVAVNDLILDITELRLPGAYSQGLVPFVAGTPLDELDTAGTLSGRLHVKADRPVELKLNLRDLHLDDRLKRFAIYGLDGVLHWSDSAISTAPESSALAWDGMYLGRLPFGQARWEFRAAGSDIRSERALKVRLFDGAMVLERFTASKLGSKDPQLAFQASLEPVSLALLTSALGWPSFPGTLAGRLPAATWQDGDLRLDGALKLEAFGGEFTIDQLHVEDPLGLVPRAYADINLRQLDLTQLTSVFDFGRIDGRLNADVLGLKLQKWRPVAFDARLYTPANDRSRQRISQRAVNNISRVGGGGVSAALSSGFMQYFENFAYRRIGWSCKLSKGICAMGGVDSNENENGYTIVQGKGLPRIDVIGHAQQVSWTTLLQQLQAISASRPATAQ